MIYPCNCNVNINNFNNSYWEFKKSTSDELEIVKFLLNSKNNILKKNILHIGVGNSYLAEKLCKFNYKIDGITISKKELDLAKKRKIKNYKVFLINKYSINFLKFIKEKKYDLIIDNNLKSYACCNKSFYFFFNNLNNSMRKNSYIFTSRKGLNWVKLLKTKLTFSFRNFFYFKLKEYESTKNNILSFYLCKFLADKYNLYFFYNDKIVFFKKK